MWQNRVFVGGLITGWDAAGVALITAHLSLISASDWLLLYINNGQKAGGIVVFPP